ncbi:MAG: hypothetical protein M3Q03_16545 [Chloroflexota bacterium]|nr:hypothetical protein [Chloroflexota bacterium]
MALMLLVGGASGLIMFMQDMQENGFALGFSFLMLIAGGGLLYGKWWWFRRGERLKDKEWRQQYEMAGRPGDLPVDIKKLDNDIERHKTDTDYWSRGHDREHIRTIREMEINADFEALRVREESAQELEKIRQQFGLRGTRVQVEGHLKEIRMLARERDNVDKRANKFLYHRFDEDMKLRPKELDDDLRRFGTNLLVQLEQNRRPSWRDYLAEEEEKEDHFRNERKAQGNAYDYDAERRIRDSLAALRDLDRRR